MHNSTCTCTGYTNTTCTCTVLYLLSPDMISTYIYTCTVYTIVIKLCTCTRKFRRLIFLHPIPNLGEAIPVPTQAHLYTLYIHVNLQTAEPLRCLALRTKGGRLKSSKTFVPWELSLPTSSGSWTRAENMYMYMH